jgi:hypothetical protein
LKEKDELNQRLIRANNDKLAIKPVVSDDSVKQEDDYHMDKDVHLWSCGILTSMASLDKFLPS